MQIELGDTENGFWHILCLDFTLKRATWPPVMRPEHVPMMSPHLSVAYQRFEQLSTEALRLLPGIGIAVVIFVLFLVASHWVRLFVQHVNARRFHNNLVTVLGRMAQWGIILLGLLLAITIAFPSFTPANLISALGITGIAIGFAFKDIFENFLAGILILVTEPFRIDDQIISAPSRARSK